jgi:hypothetical protein
MIPTQTSGGGAEPDFLRKGLRGKVPNNGTCGAELPPTKDERDQNGKDH